MNYVYGYTKINIRENNSGANFEETDQFCSKLYP